MTTHKTVPALSERAEHYWPEDRPPDLCRRGLHDLSDPANVRRRSGGKRQCKPCQKERQRRWAEGHRERYNANKRAEHGRNRERRLAAQRGRYAELRRCRRGHVQDTAIEYTRPDGRHECRRCRRRYQAAWRARQKES